MKGRTLEVLRKLTGLGVFAVIVYVCHVVIGGLLWEGYSHLMQPISDLTASGAPHQGLLSAITLIYGVSSIIFAASAYLYTKTFAPRITRLGMLLFLGMHLVSITYGLFPQDLPGSAVTFTGIMHLVVTALIVPLTIIAPILVGLGLRSVAGFRNYGRYSIATGITIFITGGTTAVFFAKQMPYFGLVERINIGVLLLWMVVTSIKLLAFREIVNNKKGTVILP